MSCSSTFFVLCIVCLSSDVRAVIAGAGGPSPHASAAKPKPSSSAGGAHGFGEELALRHGPDITFVQSPHDVLSGQLTRPSLKDSTIKDSTHQFLLLQQFLYCTPTPTRTSQNSKPFERPKWKTPDPRVVFLVKTRPDRTSEAKQMPYLLLGVEGVAIEPKPNAVTKPCRIPGKTDDAASFSPGGNEKGAVAPPLTAARQRLAIFYRPPLVGQEEMGLSIRRPYCRKESPVQLEFVELSPSPAQHTGAAPAFSPKDEKAIPLMLAIASQRRWRLKGVLPPDEIEGLGDYAFLFATKSLNTGLQDVHENPVTVRTGDNVEYRWKQEHGVGWNAGSSDYQAVVGIYRAITDGKLILGGAASVSLETFCYFSSPQYLRRSASLFALIEMERRLAELLSFALARTEATETDDAMEPDVTVWDLALLLRNLVTREKRMLEILIFRLMPSIEKYFKNKRNNIVDVTVEFSAESFCHNPGDARATCSNEINNRSLKICIYPSRCGDDAEVNLIVSILEVLWNFKFKELHLTIVDNIGLPWLWEAGFSGTPFHTFVRNRRAESQLKHYFPKLFKPQSIQSPHQVGENAQSSSTRCTPPATSSERSFFERNKKMNEVWMHDYTIPEDEQWVKWEKMCGQDEELCRSLQLRINPEALSNHRHHQFPVSKYFNHDHPT